MKQVRQFEQVGVLRALLFLRNGEKTAREFEKIMSPPTWIKAREVLLELGLMEVEEGPRRSLIHSLTEKGASVSDLLQRILEEVINPN